MKLNLIIFVSLLLFSFSSFGKRGDEQTEATGYSGLCPFCTDHDGNSAHSVNVDRYEESSFSIADRISFPPKRGAKKGRSGSGTR